MNIKTKASRRDFLKISTVAGGGLLIGFSLYSCKSGPKDPQYQDLEINAYIKINGDGTATILAQNPDIGQGVKTSLPMILAEELDLPWDKVMVEQAKLDSRMGAQFAGGSMSVTTNYENLRKAGAAVREVLIAAAAAKWQVSNEDCTTEDGYVINGKNKLHYGHLAEEAAKIELAEEPKLKDPKDFKLVGKSIPDVDLKKIVTGQPLYGLDQEVEGMVYATVLKPEVFGSTLDTFDAGKAKELKGVIDVFKIDAMEKPTQRVEGVAIVADNIWTAFKAKKLVEAKWTKPVDYISSMDHLHENLAKGIERKGSVLREDGNVDKAFSKSNDVMEATYEVPYISHSQMEPMNFIADVKVDEVRLIGPTQTPGSARYYANKITGIAEENISVEFTRIGGGFGRRLANDYANEAVFISHKIKKPVQLVWNRENDFLGDFYRPAGCYKFKAVLDGSKVTAFEANICTTSRRLFSGSKDKAHETEAFADQQPAGMVPNFKITYEPITTNVPVGALRTPGVNATTFAYQCFIDELAEKSKMDPIDFQLQMIGEEVRDMPYSDHGGPSYNTGKLRGVIELVRQKSGWDTKPPDGVYRGFAGQMVFGTYVAIVTEISMVNDKVKIQKVYAATDCGRVINPIGAEAQIQGGITDAISAAFYEQINLTDGALTDQNFDKYLKLRMKDSPDVEVHFVESDDHPQGLGEPSYPVLFPALCNAVYAATGKRVRDLPLKKHGLI